MSDSDDAFVSSQVASGQDSSGSESETSIEDIETWSGLVESALDSSEGESESNLDLPPKVNTKGQMGKTSLKEAEAIAFVAAEAFAETTMTVGNPTIQRAQQIVAGTIPSQLSGKAKANIAIALQDADRTYERGEKLQVDNQKLKGLHAFVQETEKALLGYARISFATTNDLGRGPCIIRRHFNPRPIKRSGITKLRSLHLNQALNQASTEKSHHLKVLVRRGIVDVDKLSSDWRQPDYPRISWAENIKSQIEEAGDRILATVADGNHRATFTQELTMGQVEKYGELLTAINAKMGPDNSEAIKVARDHLELLYSQIESISGWNCAVYDWDLLEESKNSDALLLRLSENDLLFNQPDTNEESLIHLLRSISGLKTVGPLLKIHRQGRVVKSTTFDSIFKDEESLITYAKVYEFEAQRDARQWTPALIFQWQACATPILSPYIDHMTRILHWLASYDDMDLKDENNVSIVADMLANGEDLLPILDDRLFDKAFFRLLEEAYMRNLKPAIISFGCGSDMDDIQLSDIVAGVSGSDDGDDVGDLDRESVIPEGFDISWARAYETYIQEISQNLQIWSKGRLQAMENYSTPIKAHLIFALRNLVPRIKFIHRHKLFAFNLLLPSSSPPPLLSVSFYSDLAKSLADVGNGVALLYTWFEPFMLAMHFHTHARGTNKGNDRDEKAIVSKPPNLFKEWLIYHLVRSKPIDTIELSSEEAGLLDEVNLMMTKINSIILRHREGGLLGLSRYAAKEKEIWKKYESLKFFPTRHAYKTHLSKLGVDKVQDPNWMPKAVLASEVILNWRLQAQTLERSVEDEAFKTHHKSRADEKSKKGTLFKPHLAAFPKEKFTEVTSEEKQQLHDIKDMLFLTACNWGGFINNNSLSTKYVRYVLEAIEVRESILAKQILQDVTSRGIFDDIVEVLNDMVKPPTRLRRLLTLPPKSAAVKVEGRFPAVYTSIAHAEAEVIHNEFQNGIVKLQELVEKHGTISEQNTTSVIKGYRALSMAFAEVALWNAGVFTGAHSAAGGDIKPRILKEKLETVNEWFPEEESGLSARDAAKLLKPKTVANISVSASENRLSNTIARDWSKADKRTDNENKRMAKSVAQYNFFQLKVQDPQEGGTSSHIQKPELTPLPPSRSEGVRVAKRKRPPKTVIQPPAQPKPEPAKKRTRLEDKTKGEE